MAVHVTFRELRVALHGATPHAAELDKDEVLRRNRNATQSIHCDTMLTDPMLAEELGVNVRTVLRWRTENRIPVHQAEDVCDHIGIHPSTVWPEYHHLLDEQRKDYIAKKLEGNRERARRRRAAARRSEDVVPAA